MMERGEWQIYRQCWGGPNADPVLDLLQDYALRPVVAKSYKSNVTVTLPPMRFSGDMNTSLGNSIHNYLLIHSGLLHV